MRKLMWLLSALALWTVTPAAPAQLVRPYEPRFGGRNVPNVYGRRDPFGSRVPGISAMPSVYDPFGRSNVYGPTGHPLDCPPWMLPTVQDILNPHHTGDPILGQRFNPLIGLDPLTPYRVPGGMNVNPAVPGVNIAPMVPPTNPPPLEQIKLDPKVLELSQLPSAPKTLEEKAPPKEGGGGPPHWLRWEGAAGVFILALLGGLLHTLTRSGARED